VGRAALFARALWWRRGLGAAVLVVATITTAVAALGPLYAEAAAQSTLTDRLVATPSAQTGLSFTQRADLSEPGAIGSLLTQLPAPGSVRAYPSRITGTNIPVTARTGQLLSLTTLVSRPGFCAHLIVLSGRCPTSPHEAIVDDNALHGRPNWALGQVVTVTYGTSEAAFGPLLDQVKIVGSYRPIDTDDPFWFGRAFFTAHESPVAIPDQLNAMFVADSENSVLPPGTIGGVEADYPLAAGQVRLATIGSLQRDVARIQQRFPAAGPTSGAGPAMRTALASVLDESRADHHQVDVDTLLVIAELTILAWIALFGVVADSIGARGSDIALAKLRGHSRAAVLVMTVAEPVALVVLALPLGLLLALGVAHQLADSVLVAGTPVVLTPAVAGALGAAFAGGALAALIAARSVLARPVLEQWRNTTSSLNQGRASRWTLLAELALVVLAVTGVVVLRSSGGSPSTLALAAPGVLLFAIAIAGARFIPAAVRLRLRSSIGSSRVALFVALRQLVRRRAGLRLASLLAVSVGLASFAIAAETVAAGNRSARAQTELGAPTVASVQFQPQHDPQTIVAQVDSTGSWAMAAATWLPDGGAPSAGPASVVGTVLAVDPARLAATGTDVRGQPTMAAIAASITVPSAVPVTFTGTQLRVTLDAESITGQAPLVGLRVRPTHQLAISVRAGELVPGTHDYTAPVDCAAGCSFAGITWERQVNQAEDEGGTVILSAVTADAGTGFRPVPVDLAHPAQWRGDSIGSDATTSVGVGPAGLAVHFRSENSSSAILAYADTPARIPLLATPAAISVAPHSSGSTDIGGMLDYTASVAAFTIAQQTSVLPQVLDAGVIADLNYLRIQLPDFDAEANWSIWLGPNAPGDAVSRLRDAGLIVQDVRTEHHRVAVLSRQAPALALILLLVCAVAASVLAVGGTVTSLAAGGRRRAFELAALRVIGVRPAVLRRSCVLEQVLLLGASLVIGLPAGVVIAGLVMPSIPEFSDATPTVLRYTPAVAPIVVFGAAFAVLVLATAVVAGVVLARSAVPARLRETTQ